MKINLDVKKTKDSLIINNRWEIVNDGTIYDNETTAPIPLWLFEFRDFVLKNHKTMGGIRFGEKDFDIN